LGGNERKMWKVSRGEFLRLENYIDVVQCEVLSYPHCWLTKRNWLPN